MYEVKDGKIRTEIGWEDYDTWRKDAEKETDWAIFHYLEE